MTIPAGSWRRIQFLWAAACACCLLSAGCSDSSTSAGAAHPAVAEKPAVTDAAPPGENKSPSAAELPDEAIAAGPADVETPVDATPAEPTAITDKPVAPQKEPAEPSAKDRSFAVEGPDGALRVGFDDLDLLKVIRMDPVTPDCKEKMPGWLRNLDGKRVRIRGFMKPGLLLTGIPQFLFVRDTGLCCFGPKGKVYDMIAVTLKAGTTTDYIELRPFDVVGTFRIEVLELDDGTIFGLYYIDDGVIIQSGR